MQNECKGEKRMNLRCKVKNCYKEVLSLGFCNRHWKQNHLYGHVLKTSLKDPCKIKVFKNHAKIELLNINHKKIGYALIDVDDVVKIKQSRWHLHLSHGISYAISTKLGPMHRYLLSLIDSPLEVDHINGNGLDNRKKNLRAVTHLENMRNSHRCDPEGKIRVQFQNRNERNNRFIKGYKKGFDSWKELIKNEKK